MKIVMIGQKGIPALFGGIERHVEELSLRMAKNTDLKVFVYTRGHYTPKRLKRYKKVGLIHLPCLPTKHLDAISHTFFACFHAGFKLKPEIIHFHGIGPALLLWLAKLLNPSAKIVFTYHCQDYFHQKWGGFARFCLKLGEKVGCRWADEVIAVSQELGDYVLNNYQRSARIISHGVNHQELSKPDLIKKWGLQKGGYLLTVSRLIRHKGIHYLIKAYQEIKPDKKLVVVGSCFHTQDYQKELEQMAAEDPNILFLGNQSGRALQELFANAWLFVNPSEQEGLPLSVLEASGFGLPLLLSDIQVHRKMLGGLPYFFKNKDADDLKKQLKYLLSQRADLSQRARKIKAYSQKRYDWEDVVEKTILAYA